MSQKQLQPSNWKFKTHHRRGIQIATNSSCKEWLVLEKGICLFMGIDNHLIYFHSANYLTTFTSKGSTYSALFRKDKPPKFKRLPQLFTFLPCFYGGCEGEP